MSDTFNYSLLQREDGNYILRSTITSFGLNQVTDKDIVSFYKQFSASSCFDTGLLPLDGTGVLSIRSAGHHMQVTIQHAPGSYHINWGATEGDREAKTYFLAQPYRIVVGDFVNGTLLGAKMFYSPYPITHPNQQLYHVNLPNINCKGYRGNAVGWICLYLKQDWSQFSFNEKVSKLIERCSGVETYNDANMSETDGPRFYESNRKPEYLWNPYSWQNKTTAEGHAWTLDPDLWIPIKVRDMDNQDRHDPNGVDFTLAMALLGNYQAYYTDKEQPKLYNVFARQDLNFTNAQIANMFKSSFAIAPAIPSHDPKDNPYQFSVDHRENKSAQQQINLSTKDEDDNPEETWMCYSCDETFSENENAIFDHSGNAICSSCIDEHYVYLETPGEFYSKDHDSVYWSQSSESWLHSELDSCRMCPNCDYAWGEQGEVPLPITDFKKPFVDINGNETESVCPNCVTDFAENNGFESMLHVCDYCKENTILNSSVTFSEFVSRVYINPIIGQHGKVIYVKQRQVYCKTCAHKALMGSYVCPCGLLNQKPNDMVSCSPTKFEVGPNGEHSVTVSSCCKSCIGDFQTDDNGNIIGTYVPVNKESFEHTINSFSKIEKDLNLIGVESHLNSDKNIF